MTENPFQTNAIGAQVEAIGNERTKIVQIADFFKDPEAVVAAASDKTYARINPHYPGVRAPVEAALLHELIDLIASQDRPAETISPRTWKGEAWYSIVTCPPQRLTPIQRLPHFDGFNEDQVAVMIYLNHTAHGGTAFFRQRATGFERITEQRFPEYKARLEDGVRKSGLPEARYVTDGAPHFEKIGETDAAFNSLVIYPGTLLHSGVIRNDIALESDPARARLTINGFFSPA